MEVAFAVLGELRVVVDGTDVTPHAPKERAVLAMLAAHRGQVVATDRLVEALWPELPLHRGRRVLQVRVAEIRRRLARAGAAGLVQSVPSGYRLNLEAGVLDADRFTALVDQGRDRAQAGDAAGAARLLREAQELWHASDAYADVRACAALEQEADRLADLRLTATEAWVGAELGAGRHAEVCAELDGLVAAHPFQERLWALWMLALYRAGRQADALTAYGRVRRLLVEELGIEPGPELRDLERAILVHDPDLDWTGPPEPAAAPGGGVGGGEGAAVPHNLPAVDPLIGRDVDVAAVVGLLGAHRLVTATGPPGVGKSRLALAVAHELVSGGSAGLGDGVWLVELAPLGEPSGLVGALAGVLPLPSMPTNAAELVDQVGSRRMLAVLDNCEHLVDEVAVLVSQLLAACSGVRVLCTSQETLAVDREHVWALRPLTRDAAVELFSERARAVRPDLVDDPGAVGVIVGRLDGLPLAIELAAARAAALTPAEIAAQLDDRFTLLSGSVRGRHPRHRALAAMVDWGHELLGPTERRLFRRLGVFTGSFTRLAAVDITDLEGHGPVTAGDRLDHLVRRSLVVADAGTDGTRYRLLETLRFYALDRLAEAGEAETLSRRHAEWYAEFALGFAAVWSPDETMWLQRGIDDWDNLRAAVIFAIAHGDTDLAVRLVGRLWRLQVLWRPELLDWARQVLTLPGAGQHPEAGYVQVTIGRLAWITGGIEESLHAAQRALQRPLDEDASLRAGMVLASTLVYSDRLDEAAAVHVAASARVTSLPNRTLCRAHALGAEAYTGQASRLDPHKVIAEADATDIPGLRSFTRTMVALCLTARGQSAEACQLVHDALEIVQPPGLDRWAINIANEILALAEGTAAQDQAADDLAERAAHALDLTREYPMGLGFALIGLVVTAHRQGQDSEAAMLTGFLSANLSELQLPAHSAEVMAGGPLERFVTPASWPEFERGKAMTSTQFRAELERLATAGALAEVVPITGRKGRHDQAETSR